jgi:hypothetical protein
MALVSRSESQSSSSSLKFSKSALVVLTSANVS